MNSKIDKIIIHLNTRIVRYETQKANCFFSPEKSELEAKIKECREIKLKVLEIDNGN